MFNWNGTIIEDAKDDEKNFDIALKHLRHGVMGFEVFEISGDPENIQRFLDYYELELDTETGN